MVVSASAPCVDQFPRRRAYDARKRPLNLERRPDRRRVQPVNVSDVLAASEATRDGSHPFVQGGGGGGGGSSSSAPSLEVLLAKVDVEGGELDVLESLLPLMRRRQLLNLVVEITPAGGQGHEEARLRGGADARERRARHRHRSGDRRGRLRRRHPGPRPRHAGGL